MNKKTMKNIFILIICVFIIIPIILLLFDINPFSNSIQEGATFTGNDDSNKKIDKVNINGIQFSPDDDVIQKVKDSIYTNDSYLWCPGGDISINNTDENYTLDVSYKENDEYNIYGIFSKSYQYLYDEDNSTNWFGDNSTNFCHLSGEPITPQQCHDAMIESGSDPTEELSGNVNCSTLYNGGYSDLSCIDNSDKPNGCFYDIINKTYHYNNNATFEFREDNSKNTFEKLCISGGLANNAAKRQFVYCDNYLGNTTTNALVINTGIAGTNEYPHAPFARYDEIGGTGGGGDEKGELAGFIGPYISTPIKDISNNTLTLVGEHNDNYNQDISTSSCFLYQQNTTCAGYDNVPIGFNYSAQNAVSTTGGTDTTTTSGDIATCSTSELKCLADYGSNIGDSLCCGQTGIVQNNNNICPSEYPKCIGYECGKTWGKCSKE